MYFVCCKILGVEPGADINTIKAAYRKSAKELHPDKNDSEKAEEYFMLLNNAYEYLMTHQYTDEELQVLWQERQRKNKAQQRYKNTSGNVTRKAQYSRSKSSGYTLREVLKQSRTARIFYISFHVLFLFVGLWLIAHSIYNLFFENVYGHLDPVTAYFVLIFGLFMGVILSVTFLITGFSFLRNRV